MFKKISIQPPPPREEKTSSPVIPEIKPTLVTTSSNKKVFIFYFATDLKGDLKQDEELKIIKSAIETSPYKNLIELVTNKDPVYQLSPYSDKGHGSLDQLTKMLVHIATTRENEGELGLLHLSCRGDADKIQLAGAKEVTYHELMGRLVELQSATKKSKIPCILLSICLSLRGTFTLQPVSDFVIGATRKIGADFTLDVTAQFYKQFMEGKSLGEATKHINIQITWGIVKEDSVLTDGESIAPFVVFDTGNPNAFSYSLKKIQQAPTLSRAVERLNFAQLKYVQSENDYDLYTPLDGVHGRYTPSAKPYKLREEIILPFLKNPKKKTLLVLGEAGTGKTKFAEKLTEYLLEDETVRDGRIVVPLYVRLADSRIKNLGTNIVEEVLKTFGLSDEEIHLLVNSDKIAFCFIFDGMDELLRKDKDWGTFYDTNRIRTKFPTSHSIFTARLSGLPANYEAFFEPKSDAGERFIPSEQEGEISLAPFDEKTKIKYIGNFILKKDLAKTFGYTDAPTIYQRIKSISHLDEIVGRPILLMMTMHVLPYLEVLYKKEQVFFPEEVIQRDLLHMYTHWMYTRAKDKLLQRSKENPELSKDLQEIKEDIYELIVIFSIRLAKLMNTDGHLINEVSEDEVFGGGDDFSDEILTTLTKSQKEGFKKFFSLVFVKEIYRNELEYKKYRYSREGCDLLQARGDPGHFIYRFLHDDFLDYFATLTPQSLKGQRSKIKDFMDEYKPTLEQTGAYDTESKPADPPSLSLGDAHHSEKRGDILERARRQTERDAFLDSPIAKDCVKTSTTTVDTVNAFFHRDSFEISPPIYLADQTKRHGLFLHEKKDSSEKQAVFTREIPGEFGLGEAEGKGDCFFDACAQELNELSGREEYTIKSLRLLCHEYVVALDKRCGNDPKHPDNWIAKTFNNPAKYREYFANIRYTVEEREAGEGVGDDRVAIWGEQHIDGRIICEKLGIRLHVIEVRENPEEETNKAQKFIASHNLVDQRGLKNVGQDDIDWKDKKTIHIGVCNLHFVPILKRTEGTSLGMTRSYSKEGEK